MSDALTKLGEAARRARAAISPWQYITPTDVAGALPGGGIASAAQPYGEGLKKTAEATKAFREGRYGDAARNYGSGLLDTATAGLSAAGDVAPLAKLAMSMIPAAKKVAGIRAFHGSPHDFDRFSMDKIGTGEGAQAYGHGLYFAESEGVARSYREKLAMDAATIDGRSMADWASESYKLPYGTQPSVEHKIADIVSSYGDQAANVMKARYPELQKEYDAMVAAGRIKEPGRMYEVRINADPEQFLDWDKPLSEQPNAEIAVGRYLERVLDQPGPIMNDVFDKFERGQMTGADVAKLVGADTTPLREAGIPGIKYLDAGSRSAGDGSRNYVVFDDKLVEIVKKYGWAPGMAIPAAMALELQQAQEQSAPQM